MYYNRFDIVEAYYCFAFNYLTGRISLRKSFIRKKLTYADYVRFCRKVDDQLERLKFKPRLSLESGEPKHLTENSKAIYLSLVQKYFG